NSSGSILVTPLALDGLAVTGLPSSIVAGTSSGVTVTAVDIYGNRVTGYLGTVHFSSSDPQAGLPADYTFTAADNSSHSLTVMLKTAGNQSFSVADTVDPTFAATQSGIVVAPAAASVFTVTGLSASATAGTAQTFTVTALDPFGNRAQYFGEVVFSSSDTQAILPPTSLLTLAAGGSQTFTATFRSAGPQTITIQNLTGS